MTNPLNQPQDWSRLIFTGKSGTVTVPGIVVSIDGHDVTDLWVVQKPQDSSWAVTVWRGRLLNESIKVEILLTSPSDYDSYVVVRDLLQPKPFTAANAANQPTWDVINGALAFAKITRVGIRSIGTPRAQPDLSWRAVIDLIQYRPIQVSKVGPPDPPKKKTENDLKADQLQNLIGIAKDL